MPPTVLVTGATGFGGSALVEQLAAQGCYVHGTYRALPAAWPEVPETVTLHELDLRDAAQVGPLLAAVQPELVFHLAAQSSVTLSLRDPIDTFAHNVNGQYNLLEAVAADVPRARVLLVGSCDEYGDVALRDNPIAEDHELRPLNPYALSKVAQDLMGYQYHATAGLDIVRARPFLQIGPRRSDRFVAGWFARQVAEIEAGMREPVIEVGNIDLRRDFTDVRDVARAFVSLVDRGESGQVYNVASGREHTLRDLLDAMVSLSGRSVEVRPLADLRRRGEPPLLVGDASRIRSATGWEPQISFEQSALDTLDYWRQRTARGHVAEAQRP